MWEERKKRRWKMEVRNEPNDDVFPSFGKVEIKRERKGNGCQFQWANIIHPKKRRENECRNKEHVLLSFYLSLIFFLFLFLF